MSIEFRERNGELLWVRNPFTGAATYFTHVHKKRSGFVNHAADPIPFSEEETSRGALRREAERQAALRACPFCPGNEAATRDEIVRVNTRDLWPSHESDGWLIRAVQNIIPRIPEACTGGRNESYVVIEDPRHYAHQGSDTGELLCTAMLAPEHFQALLDVDVEISRRAYANPEVESVLIRKNQGPESGASQPHPHNQVIGADIPFPVIQREHEVARENPRVWHEIVAFAREHGFVLAEHDGCIAYFCPFGTFPRSYDVVCLDDRVRLIDLPERRRRVFVGMIFEMIKLLGNLPLDYEIHEGLGVPLHAHLNSRHYAYSNIGGTLNLPSNLLNRPTRPNAS